VYLATADGILACGGLKDMLNGVESVHCRVSVSGPFETPSNAGEIPSWLEEMEGRMRSELDGLRLLSRASDGAGEKSKPLSDPGSESDSQSGGIERVG